MKVSYLASAVLGMVGVAHGRFSVDWPCPRFSPSGKDCPSLPPNESYDADINSPIGTADAGKNMPLCRHSASWSTNSAVLNVKDAVTVSFSAENGSTAGGFCQYSISYDGGKTFAVVHQQLGDCFVSNAGNLNEVSTEYTFDLPKNLPSSKNAIFAWTYVNPTQDAAFYMNCADVEIVGSDTKSFSGPEMTILNYNGKDTLANQGSISNGKDIYDNAKIIEITVESDASIAKRHNKEAKDEEDCDEEGGDNKNPKVGSGGSGGSDSDSDGKKGKGGSGGDGTSSGSDSGGDDDCESDSDTEGGVTNVVVTNSVSVTNVVTNSVTNISSQTATASVTNTASVTETYSASVTETYSASET
ncbi:hypothetical protein IWW43_002897 [Coemansia sp. RSA 1935]|nr:hypothetical protein IWW43_002897 [Coemansia sp. RSA 1935]